VHTKYLSSELAAGALPRLLRELQKDRALDALLLDVLDVEPSVNDFACGDELRDLAFEEDLQLDRHLTDPFIE
jgi:hypothetical protein